LHAQSRDSNLLPAAEVLKVDRTDVVGYTYDWLWLFHFNGDNLGQDSYPELNCTGKKKHSAVP